MKLILRYKVNLEFENFKERQENHLTFQTFSSIEVKHNQESKYIVLHAGAHLEILSATYHYLRQSF